MSIANENNRVDITATGGQTAFAYNFKINADDEIAVYLTPNGSDPDDSTDLLTLTTDYTVDGVGEDAGGNINLTAGSYPSGATAGDVVVAIRAIPYKQVRSFNVGADSAISLEAALDDLAMRLQRLSEEISRTPRNHVTLGPVSDVISATDILDAETNAVAAAAATAADVAATAADVITVNAAAAATAADVIQTGSDLSAVEALFSTIAEGTFTPDIYAASSGGSPVSITGKSAGGRYCRIGNLVYFSITISGSDSTEIPSGLFYIGDLPFAGYYPSNNPYGMIVAKASTLSSGPNDGMSASIVDGVSRIILAKPITVISGASFSAGSFNINASGTYITHDP